MRAIVHIDLDAFYSQVEQKRLQCDPNQPLVCQQWNGIIAVNYPARAKGITRHMNILEAKEKCPELILAHVPTYKKGEMEYKYHNHPKKSDHKVSLDEYRLASDQIMQVCAQVHPVEKASIDEMYLDCTERVQELVGTVDRATWDWHGTNLLDQEPMTDEDEALYHASMIAFEIRTRLKNELGFTCSAGIAHNKTLAKLASSRNKPNKQTAILSSAVALFMNDIPYQKIGGLGGKLGQQLQSRFGSMTCGQMHQISFKDLQAAVGQEAQWVFDIVRGICNDSVVSQQPPKTLSSFKNFSQPITNFKDLELWTYTLSAELSKKAHGYFTDYQKWPQHLGIHVKASTETESKSCTFPNRQTSIEDLAKMCIQMMGEMRLPPCISLSLTASKFDKEQKEAGKMKSWLQKVKQSAAVLQSNRNQTDSVQETQSTLLTDRKDLEGGYKCDRCQMIVFPDPILIQEHQDFHFAKDLAEPPQKKPKTFHEFFKKR
ncbi:hypothetical protein EDD86DRAFT_190715 [Gorgonomyces haynaldii]|nr:hypothetical protein EDD86DRAFT_190715 [Gorgonomyces haynaldii]